MRLSTTASILALCASSAYALSDSSPFVLISTAPFDQSASVDQLQTSTQVLTSAKAILSSCPTKKYLFVSQPNAHAADLRGCGSSPRLCAALSDKAVRATMSVAEVVGAMDVDALASYVKSTCSEKGITVEVLESKLAPLPRSRNRAEALADNDYVLDESLQKLQSSDSYTIVYLSSPIEPTYEADFSESFPPSLHAELKRDARAVPVHGRAKNSTEWDKLPLFEKYQFFTPGIFMGLLAVLFLLSVLTVGLRALSSLEVSYGAFEKDMGPAAQKKQM